MNSTVNQSSSPKLIRKADAQIEELLMNINRPENLYALQYILEHEGKSASVEVLAAAMESLYPQKTDKVFSEETPIKLEWQLRIIMIILELMCERKFQFTCQFLDDTRSATSMYKKINKRIMQHGGKVWKSNCAEFNGPDENTKSLNAIMITNILSKLLRIR